MQPLFASALSVAHDSQIAEREALDRLSAGLDGRTPDLVTVFVSHHHGAAIEKMGNRIAQATGSPALIGCTGESIIGANQEVERSPAISLWAACLPDTEIRPFHVSASKGSDGPLFEGAARVEDPEQASALLLADPFSFPMDAYLKLLNRDQPGMIAVGGMASGGHGPGQNLLMTERGLQSGGAIGVILEGATEVHSVVSQGCRPVGKPWVITASEKNMINKLGGRKALEVMLETLKDIAEGEQLLFKNQPFIGLAMDSSKSTFERGDFLVRNIMGFQPQEHAIAVADMVRRGQTIQFLVRDADSASEDLEELLKAHVNTSCGDAQLAASKAEQNCGALLFSCNGRGSRMFKQPNHDVSRIKSALHDELPVSGFFAMGEIGPVGGQNHLHGLTASVALFRKRTE